MTFKENIEDILLSLLSGPMILLAFIGVLVVNPILAILGKREMGVKEGLTTLRLWAIIISLSAIGAVISNL